ncbi:hypothetical protein Pcinc_028606 [Petrolisthes cinctipes]|uniref:Uncharacterized protein n=1 Tax=Petrolisthes cinctipes TaxID=88211 RepID=A0AAE1F1Q1_PETCI|nr:hypothetical protein Pcinc_028606 [Petrolisthes cinctipes]
MCQQSMICKAKGGKTFMVSFVTGCIGGLRSKMRMFVVEGESLCVGLVHPGKRRGVLAGSWRPHTLYYHHHPSLSHHHHHPLHPHLPPPTIPSPTTTHYTLISPTTTHYTLISPTTTHYTLTFTYLPPSITYHPFVFAYILSVK